NYSNSNSMVDYFDRGYYGRASVNTKLQTSMDNYRKAQEVEQRELRKDPNSEKREKATNRRIREESNIKKHAQERVNRIQAYRKRHIIETTKEGTPQRTQGDYKVAMGSGGAFSPAAIDLKPEIETGNGFTSDDIAFNHNPLGSNSSARFEE